MFCWAILTEDSIQNIIYKNNIRVKFSYKGNRFSYIQKIFNSFYKCLKTCNFNRGYKFFKDLNESLRFMEKNDYKFDIIFLEADDNTLVRRYKMTRRKHPLALEDNIFQGIQRERAMLEELKQQSGYIINTTKMNPSDLKDEINNIFKEGKEKTNLIIF